MNPLAGLWVHDIALAATHVKNVARVEKRIDREEVLRELSVRAE
jgi:hypothetical protein